MNKNISYEDLLLKQIELLEEKNTCLEEEIERLNKVLQESLDLANKLKDLI